MLRRRQAQPHARRVAAIYRTCVLMALTARPLRANLQKELIVTMTVDTPAVDVLDTEPSTPEVVVSPVAPTAEAPTEEKPQKATPKKATGKRTKTLELTLTVTGTADGEWHAELKQGSTYLARNLAVAAAAVSRAAKELHEDLSTPIDAVIEEARSQQAAKVAALEAELEAARKALADLD
jgi:Family of unknown function (DUF6319)